MRRLALLTLVLPLALTACNKPAENKPVMRIDFDHPDADFAASASASPEPSATPGVVSACEDVTFEDAKFTHCVADPAKHRIVLADLGADRTAYRSFKALDAARGPDAPRVVFAMNAGMFDGEGKPVGYYVENGNRTKELEREGGPGNFRMKPNGVFFGSGGKWQIRTADDFYAQVGDRPQFGTQSGPMLVIAGKLHPQITDDGPSRTVRNGVGVDGTGRAHFVISDGPVSFGKLARYFRDVLKTRNALYLDGGVSSLWDPASGRMDAPAPIGPMIVVEEKEPQQ